MRSTSGSIPYGVVGSLLIRSIIPSTPSYSFPWIALWRKIGIFPSRVWALAGTDGGGSDGWPVVGGMPASQRALLSPRTPVAHS
jgi:hypothetical protein